MQTLQTAPLLQQVSLQFSPLLEQGKAGLQLCWHLCISWNLNATSTTYVATYTFLPIGRICYQDDISSEVGVAPGAGLGERQSPAAVSTIDNMSREEALRALARSHALRETVRGAVYDYWKAKRLRRGKPLLRRLQAPTASSDSNPFNVFR